MKKLGYELALLVLGLSAFALGATTTKTATKAPTVVSKTTVPAKQSTPVVVKAAPKASAVVMDAGKVQRAGYGWSATFTLSAGQTLRVYVEDAKGVKTYENSFVLAPRHKKMMGRVSIGGVPQ